MKTELENVLLLNREQLIAWFGTAPPEEIRDVQDAIERAARGGVIGVDVIDRVIDAGAVAARRIGSRADVLERRRLAGIRGVIRGGKPA